MWEEEWVSEWVHRRVWEHLVVLKYSMKTNAILNRELRARKRNEIAWALLSRSCFGVEARWTKTGTKITFFPFRWQIYAQNWKFSVLQCSFYGFNSIYIKWIENNASDSGWFPFLWSFRSSFFPLVRLLVSACLFVWILLVFMMPLVHLWWLWLYMCSCMFSKISRWWCALHANCDAKRVKTVFSWIKTKISKIRGNNPKKYKKKDHHNAEDSTKTSKSNERHTRCPRCHTKYKEKTAKKQTEDRKPKIKKKLTKERREKQQRTNERVCKK